MEKIYKNASSDATRIFNGFKYLLFICGLFMAGNVWGQTTLISPSGDGGFENGATFAANGWTSVNHTTNVWSVGSASASFAGSNAAFISNNGGTTWAYTLTTSQTSHFYRDITIPAGETKITLTFQWKGNGESGYDRLLVYTAPTSVSPVAGTPTSSTTTLTGATLVYTQANYTQAAYTSATISLPASLAGSTFRLIFMWQNDASGGTPPGVSIDNISLISATPSTYTWIPTTGSAVWATAASWSPSRTTPDASDILNFSNGGSSNVQTASGAIGGNIVFSNNTTANFQPTAANTLTLSSLNIPSGSSMFLNGTTAQTIAFSSGATNSIGGRLEVSGAAHNISFANSVTTVISTGTLAAGGSTAATLTGSTSTLIINGNYEHKYTTVSSVIPTATWAANSNCNITGYTAASMTPTGIAQTFGNFTWNCTGQGTNNYNLSSSSTTTIQGTLSILSTGTTGSLRWTGTGGYTLNVNNYSQSGGIFDLSSGASGSAMSFNVSGSFNQTAGSFLSSGTSTNNPTVHFNGTTNQSITFATQPTGPITYRISNPAGITLTGPSANFTIGNGTLGGLRISTTAANPITFGGTTTALLYNATNSTLTYDATTGNTTARLTEFPNTSGPASLTVAVGSGNVLSIPFNRTVRTILTMTSGDIDISTNTLTLGTAATTAGSLTWVAGNIRVTTGAMTRWYNTSGLPTSLSTSSPYVGFYPLAFGTNNRNVSIFFSSATALSTGGTITVGHTNAGGLSSITSFADGAYNVDTRTNPSWTISTGNGIVASGTLSLRLTGGGALSTSAVANLHLIQASAAIGTHTSGTGTSPNFQANRSGLSLAQIANTHYIGAASADMQSVYNSVASGDWNNGSTWDVGSVPTCTGLVNIMNGHNVTVNSTGNQASTTTVNVGGTLTVASGDIKVGCTNNNTNLINNGTLTVSGGTLNVNGSLNHNAGATFNQSGGDINIDGNSGSAATSATTALLNILSPLGTVSGGRITIIDPPATSGATKSVSYSVTTTSLTWPTSHTLRLGDGVSTTAGGNANGFELDGYVGSGRHILGTLEVNGGNGTNRWTTSSASTSNGTYITNLIINSGSEYRDGAAHTSNFYILGNITNNGTLTNQSATWKLAGWNSISNTEIANPNAQTISGSGVFRNSTTTTTANLINVTINNSNATGVTINVPLSVSGTLTMTSGIINTTSTNILRLGTTTASGTLSGTPSTTNFINGPFARTFASGRTSSAFGTATLFPVGVVGATPALMSIDINPVTNATGPVIFTVQANNSMSGSAGSGVSNLASVTWSAIPDNTANLTSAQVRLNRSDASVTTNSKLLYASNNTDPFEGTPGGSTSSAGASISGATQIVTADYKNHFSYGDLVVCSAPGDQASSFIASNKTTTTFTANFDPASSNPTGYLVVRYTAAQLSAATNPVDGTLYASGSALGGTVVGNYYTAPFTFNQTSLTANTAYTYKIYSFNNTSCAGPAYNPTSFDATITTCATSYSTPTSISASNISTTSMDVNYTASTSAGVQDHFMDVASNSTFTNFVSGYQNISLGIPVNAGAQVFSLSGLNTSTTYFVRIKAVDGAGCESSYSTTLTQATDCNAETLPTAVQNFSTFTGTAPNPLCWSEKTGTLAASSTLSGSTSAWLNKSSGFANISSANMGASINLYSTKNDWIISQPIDLGNSSGNYRMRYKYAVTSYNGTTAQTTLNTHKVDIIISTNGGQTWSNANILKTYTGSGTYSNTGVEEIIDLSAYTGVIKIAIVATTTATTPDIDFHIDDFIVEQTPAPTISSVTSTTSCGGSTKIVITGTDLNNISSATIGSQSLLPFDSTSSTRLVKTISTPLNGTTSVTNNIATATNATNITFTNAPALSVDSNHFALCNGSSATVNVTSTLTDYTSYTWSPASGVSGGSSATFNPTTTTTYTLNVTNSGTGCSNMLTRTVTVDALPSAITLSQGISTAKCFSSLDSLVVSGGLVSGSSGKIGTGTSSNSTSTPFRRYYGGSKTQSLYTPSELSALGLVSGSEISSIGWVALSGTPAAMSNMSIKIGLVSSTLSSTNFATSPSNTVFSSASYTPSTGIGNLDFSLSTPLVWDGASHLLIETCFNNNDAGAGSTSNSVSVESSTVTSGLNTYSSLDNNASVCAATTGTTYTIRPNLRISFSKPATYSWSPTTGLFTNRAMTTAYSGTSLNKVYAKPSATQKYYLTATNGACTLRDSIVDSIKNATNLITLASFSTTGAVEQCTDANGWSYYASAAKPDEWLFGIYKNGNNFTATVDITVDNVNKFKKANSSNGANQEHASYTMSRYWNVNATGTVGTGVKVRFFIDPQDITDLLDERDNDYDVLKNATNPSSLAVKGGFEWFKTINTVYNPSNWNGNKHNGAIVKLTEDAVDTINGQTYVELSGITSFSGGSGGSSFGPSNNGLFNSGGSVGLPVTWKDVKATVKEEGNLIQWITSSEKNTSHFEVEYSYDAKNFFKASNDIKAAVNSTTDKSYDFMHLEEYGELVYYRIKQVDLDGKVDYSKAVVAKRTSKLPEFHASMYPVPLTVQDLNLKIQTVQKTDITITINDLLGRGVYTERVSPQGYTTDHKLSLGHLQNGTYHVTIDNGLNKSVQVLVVGK